ncbi:hypothetical protein KGQ31_03500 [Patescibacteria group bacterium]|nr:hypothetical protein [Patescibacteria group bacterium]
MAGTAQAETPVAATTAPDTTVFQYQQDEILKDVAISTGIGATIGAIFYTPGAAIGAYIGYNHNDYVKTSTVITSPATLKDAERQCQQMAQKNIGFATGVGATIGSLVAYVPGAAIGAYAAYKLEINDVKQEQNLCQAVAKRTFAKPAAPTR